MHSNKNRLEYAGKQFTRDDFAIKGVMRALGDSKIFVPRPMVHCHKDGSVSIEEEVSEFPLRNIYDNDDFAALDEILDKLEVSLAKLRNVKGKTCVDGKIEYSSTYKKYMLTFVLHALDETKTIKFKKAATELAEWEEQTALQWEDVETGPNGELAWITVEDYMKQIREVSDNRWAYHHNLITTLRIDDQVYYVLGHRANPGNKLREVTLIVSLDPSVPYLNEFSAVETIKVNFSERLGVPNIYEFVKFGEKAIDYPAVNYRWSFDESKEEEVCCEIWLPGSRWKFGLIDYAAKPSHVIKPSSYSPVPRVSWASQSNVMEGNAFGLAEYEALFKYLFHVAGRALSSTKGIKVDISEWRGFFGTITPPTV